MPTFLLTEVIEYLCVPGAVVDFGSGNTAMSGQLDVVAVTSPSPFQPIRVTVIVAVPPLFRNASVSSLTEIRHVLLPAFPCSGAGVAVSCSGVDAREVDVVCSSAGVAAGSARGGAGVGEGVSVATDAV